jgi:hypothetical protein
MIISENERNRIKKLHRNQFVLNEGLSISPEGDLVDDGMDYTISDNEDLRISDEVDVMIWVGNENFVFPGHNGTVSVIGIDEKNGKHKGVVIDEDLQDGDESLLYNKGYLDWKDDRWNFYPYYGEQSQPLNEEESQECYVAAEDDEKVWMKELSTNTNSRCKGMEGRRKKQCKINEILRDYEQKLQKRNMPSCRKGTWISTRVRKKREWLEFRMGLNKK